MNNALHVINCVVVISLFFIRNSYARIHWLISDFSRQSNGGNETITRLIGANDSTILPTIVIAVGCLISSIILIRNEQIGKNCPLLHSCFPFAGLDMHWLLSDKFFSLFPASPGPRVAGS